MDSFKKALKQAILEKAEGVRFEVGRPPILCALVEKELKQLLTLDQVSLRNLIDSLLPSLTPATDTLREGSISIVNFGELKLIARFAGTLQLYAFIPPQGNELFEKTKASLTAQSTSPQALEMPLEEPAFESSLHRGKFVMTEAFAPRPQPLPEETRSEVELPPLPQAPVPTGDELMLETAYVPSSPLRRNPSHTQNTISPSSTDLFDQPLSPLPAPVPRPLIPHADLPLRAMAEEDERTPVSEDMDEHQFQTTQHSMLATRHEFSSAFTEAGGLLPSPAPPPQLAPAAIHFGAAVPGESIERKGRLPIDAILEDMVKRRASDLHLTMDEPICLRIDGEIVRVSDQRVTEEQMRDYLMPIIPPRNRTEFAQIHDTDFAYEVPGLARFRVNIFRDRMGVGAVMRQIPDKVLSADDLGLSPAIRKLCELQKGLVIVTGPTGSGKSTTLAAMIDLINETRTDHILTIEDPIEFVHKQKRCLINQREVHRHTGSFARALRAALREDPDIILIGEMRDLETVAIAIETAETGHLVFGTLHTNTAISTVDRLIDQFPADQQEQIRVMLAESLKGIVSQTLVKKKGGGRVAAQEILLVDKAVASLIREGNTHMVQNHMQTQKAKGNVQLNDALMTLVTKGLIDPRDAYIKSIEKEALVLLLQQKGINLESLKSVS